MRVFLFQLVQGKMLILSSDDKNLGIEFQGQYYVVFFCVFLFSLICTVYTNRMSIFIVQTKMIQGKF